MLGIKIIVDGRQYRAVPNADRTEFVAERVPELAIVTGSELLDERGARYVVDQCMQTVDGYARMRVRSRA